MYFVYAILVDGVVRYIGKGTKQRPLYHLKTASIINAKRAAGLKVKALKFHNRLAKAIREGANIEYLVIVDGLSEKRAFAREIIEISTRSGLWNEDAGGKGVSSILRKKLWRNNAAYRQKMLEHNRRISRIPMTPEHISKNSANMSVYNRSDIGRRRVSKMNKQRWLDPTWRAKMSAAVRAGNFRRWSSEGVGE
jgi:hypothetical protein